MKTSEKSNLKKEYVAYYQDVPVQKYAAMAIAKDEDTIIRWRKEDPDFADAVLQAKAIWVRKKLIATKAEFALERLEKDIFSQHSTVAVEKSVYDKYVDNHQIDPNSFDSKALVEKTLSIMMEGSRER